MVSASAAGSLASASAAGRARSERFHNEAIEVPAAGRVIRRGRQRREDGVDCVDAEARGSSRLAGKDLHDRAVPDDLADQGPPAGARQSGQDHRSSDERLGEFV